MTKLKKEFKAEDVFDVCIPDYESYPDENGYTQLSYLHLESEKPHAINPDIFFDYEEQHVNNIDRQLINRLMIKEGFSNPQSYEYNVIEGEDRDICGPLYIWESERENKLQNAVDKLLSLASEEERINFTKEYTGLSDLQLEDEPFQVKKRSSRRFGR